MLVKGHLSVTQLSTYLDCSQRYWYQYVAQVPQPPTPALARGIAVHRVAEQALSARIAGLTPTADDTRTVVRESIATLAQDAAWDPDVANDTVVQAEALAVLYHETVLSEIDPAAVEVPVEYTLADVPFLGRLDVVEVDGTVRDLKTSARRPAAGDLAKNLQATAYWEAYRQLCGEPPAAIIFDYLVATKTPAAESYRIGRTADDVTRLEYVVDGVARDLSLQRFYPNPASPYCSATGCPFYARCMHDHNMRVIA